MPKIGTEPRALPSLLDRLLDEDPKRSEDPPLSRSQSIRVFKDALRRDLEWLLNTRSIADLPPEDLEELHSSLYCYGLPDVASFTLVSASGRGRLQRSILRAIEAFEPRLANVTVTPSETQTERGRAVSFVISGLLRMDPSPEQVSFDTVLELGRGEYRVKGD